MVKYQNTCFPLYNTRSSEYYGRSCYFDKKNFHYYYNLLFLVENCNNTCFLLIKISSVYINENENENANYLSGFTVQRPVAQGKCTPCRINPQQQAHFKGHDLCGFSFQNFADFICLCTRVNEPRVVSTSTTSTPQRQ